MHHCKSKTLVKTDFFCRADYWPKAHSSRFKKGTQATTWIDKCSTTVFWEAQGRQEMKGKKRYRDIGRSWRVWHRACSPCEACLDVAGCLCNISLLSGSLLARWLTPIPKPPTPPQAPRASPSPLLPASQQAAGISDRPPRWPCDRQRLRLSPGGLPRLRRTSRSC